MPASTQFPSGHAASAFAYPGDVVVGSVTGAGTAAMVATIFDRLAIRPTRTYRPGRPRGA
jgi:membrane-associated phospholipid phosphatase